MIHPILKEKIRRVDPEVWNVVVYGTPAQRKYICSKEPLYFCMYYFAPFFEYALGDYHFIFFEDFKKLVFGELKEDMWMAFRESAKTTFAKMCLTWAIVHSHKKYISYGSYDGDNAEAALFDITVWLQTNRRLIANYGNLYQKKKSRTDDLEEAQLKRKSKFITTHAKREDRVRVIAFTTQESTRGHIFGIFRPDMYVYDDFENSKTAGSQPVTEKIIAHLDEARTGLASFGCALYLCNYIRDDGSVEYLRVKLESMEHGRVRNIPVKYQNGEIAWADKYVDTTKEARKLNEDIEDKRLRKVSLEEKREEFGDSVFYTEMMNNPGKSGDYYFDREKIEESIGKAKDPIKTVGSLEIWAKYDPSHRYALGADTSEGIGADHNATAIIDFSSNPALLTASFKDNQIKPNAFAYEIAREGRMYGECYVVPEINHGYGTASNLVDADICDYSNVYIRKVKNKTTKKTQNEYGFHMNSKTKPDVLANFKSAFEDGHLEILDKGLLEEMKYFRKDEATRLTAEKGATRHFDKLISACLAWEGRVNATAKNDSDDLFTSPQSKEDRKEILVNR